MGGMAFVPRFVVAPGLGVLLVIGVAGAQDGPVDLSSAFQKTFEGVDACVALRDVAPRAEPAVSDPQACGRRAPPCGTFEIPASVIAIDRGVVPDANAPVRRSPPAEGDPPDGVNLRDAFRTPTPWVYEEVARRIGSEAFGKALNAMRYGNASSSGPVETLGRRSGGEGLAVDPPEQAEFLARLRRGELPTSAESQARTVEIMPVERVGDVSLALKSAECDGAAWAVGWVDRAQRTTIFATVIAGPAASAEDAVARTRRLLATLGLIPAPQ